MMSMSQTKTVQCMCMSRIILYSALPCLAVTRTRGVSVTYTCHVSLAHDDLTCAQIQTDALVHLNKKIDTPGKPCMMMEVVGEVHDNEGARASDADVFLVAPLCMNASMVNTSSEIR